MGQQRWVRGAVFVGLIVTGAVSVALVSQQRAVTASTARAAWETRIQVVERALERDDVSAAIYFWRDAYGEAWRSRQWEALFAVGETARRIDQVSRGRSFLPEARHAYLEALFRARTLRSHEGMRRVATAFEELGDAEVAEHARSMASPSSARQAER